MGKDGLYFQELPQGYSASVEDGVVVVRKKPEVRAMHHPQDKGDADASPLELTLGLDVDSEGVSGLQDLRDSQDSGYQQDLPSSQQGTGYALPEKKKRRVKKMLKDFPDLVDAIPEEEYAGLCEELERIRPRTRADCKQVRRPCIFVGCRYHLGLTINLKTGDYHINSKDGLFRMEESCVLDVASRGASTLDVVGKALNVTRERVRQIEDKALRKLKKFSKRHRIDGSRMRELHDDINDDW